MDELLTSFQKYLFLKECKEKTIKSYLYQIEKISNGELDFLKRHIIPTLVQEMEFSNREYFIDRITSSYALRYFERMTSYLIKNPFVSKAPIKVYIFDGKNDYCIGDSALETLYDDILLINCIFYENSQKLHFRNTPSFDEMTVHTIKSELQKKDLNIKNLAIHIVYLKSDIKRNVLTKFCDFLYDTDPTENYNYAGNHFYYMACNESPKKVGDNYKVLQPLTSKKPFQIAIKDSTRTYYHDDKEIPDLILIKTDLAKILNLDHKTIRKNFVLRKKISFVKPNKAELIKTYNIKSDETILDIYFSLSSTNEFLKDKHRFVKNDDSEQHCHLEGYSYWYKKGQALKILKVSPNFFDQNIQNICSHIEYVSGCARYFSKDLEYLSTHDKNVLNAQKRKEIYSIKSRRKHKT